MKWYWIALIVLVVLAVTYWIAIKPPSANRINCRAGTCPYIREDGSVFCTAAACNKNTSNERVESVVYNNVVAPARNPFAGITGVLNPNNGVSTNVGVGR